MADCLASYMMMMLTTQSRPTAGGRATSIAVIIAWLVALVAGLV